MGHRVKGLITPERQFSFFQHVKCQYLSAVKSKTGKDVGQHTPAFLWYGIGWIDELETLL